MDSLPSPASSVDGFEGKFSPDNTTCHGAHLRYEKRKVNDLEDEIVSTDPEIEYSSVARIEFENECTALREMVSSQQNSIHDLYVELEEERSAASSAASEAMSMILRLQREKAEVQMEARQFKRFAEEKIAHDQDEILVLEDILYKRDQIIHSLTCEIHGYKHKMTSLGITEFDTEGGKRGLSGSHSMSSVNEKSEAQFDFQVYGYPSLKCNLNETVVSEVDSEVVDNIERYNSGDTPREHLMDLEHRISELEGTPRSIQLEVNSNFTKNIAETVTVIQSPRRERNSRLLSIDSSSSVRCSSMECSTETPRPCSSFRKKECILHTEDCSVPSYPGAPSENGDDGSDRVYTIDSVHNEVKYNAVLDSETVGPGDGCLSTPCGELIGTDVGEPEIKKLDIRLQALEADRESMKQAIMSMSTDKAQFILLKEIAQQLCNEGPLQSRTPVKRPSSKPGFFIIRVLRCVFSFIFSRKRPGSRRSKYVFGAGAAAEKAGLLMLLETVPRPRQRRCLLSTDV